MCPDTKDIINEAPPNEWGNLSVKEEGFKNVHKYDVIRGSHFGANGCTGGLHVQFLVEFKHITGKNEAGEFHNTVTPNVRKTM